MSDLPTALTITATSAGFVAGVCFCIGAIRTEPKDIARASATFVGSNPTLMRSLSSQRAQYIVGALFLVVSFLLQAAAVLVQKDSPLPLPLFFQEPIALVLSTLLVAAALARVFVSLTTTKTIQSAQRELQQLKDSQRGVKS